VTDAGAEISSTQIRSALTEGRPRDAAAMLGHWHRIEGEVLHGEKRGRELGYPTANMAMEGLHLPRFGVYAVLVDVLTGPQAGSYQGAASLGVRPMFGVNTPNLETFLFDFKGDLYGQHLSVALVDYLRPELKFDGLPALITQMDADCAKARDLFPRSDPFPFPRPPPHVCPDGKTPPPLLGNRSPEQDDPGRMGGAV
jgi:riboflavin kinase / FMN adenylyltransferase